MRLVILNDGDKVSEWAARYILKRVNEFNPGPDRLFVLGLPTGNWYNIKSYLFKIIIFYFLDNYFNLKYIMHKFSFTGSTPLGTYRKLVEFYKAGKLSFKYVKTFNMDEYVGKFLNLFN